MPVENCNNIDPLKLIREGTSQDERPFKALDPAYAPVNERTPAHGMVFAQSLAAFLQYYNANHVAVDTWQRFFSQDVSLLLATAAVQDVNAYRQQVKEYFDYLNNLNNDVNTPPGQQALKDGLGYLFSAIGTLAVRLEQLKNALPNEFPLKATLQNTIKSQLAPHFKRFWSYYKNDIDLGIINPSDARIANVSASVSVLGAPAIPISEAYHYSYSTDWIPANVVAADWTVFRNSIPTENEYGTGNVFTQINRLSTHNLFTAIFDQFLKTYARITSDAKAALENSFTNYDQHEPHYALFLAFLRLLEYARTEANTLTGRHLDFYYKEVLRLREKPAEPGHAHLLVELAKHAEAHELPQGELFKAGKDDLGKAAFFANDRDFVANQAKVTALKTVYRHGNEEVGNTNTKSKQIERLYAAPVANSDDGLGEPLTSVDQSWHPFYNKIYMDGKLTEIKMPMAGVGFAVASHYLWMAEGKREITLDISASGFTGLIGQERKANVVCLFSGEKGWIEIKPFSFKATTGNNLRLVVTLTGSDPPITPYNTKVHGYGFGTTLPMMLIKLQHAANQIFPYKDFQNTVITNLAFQIRVIGLRTLAVSNDFGSVDTSKPFQPYGASPVAESAFIIGSKEVFQKKLTKLTVNLTWQSTPDPYGTTVKVKTAYLKEGKWQSSGVADFGITSGVVSLTTGLDKPVMDAPDFSTQEVYSTVALHGFVRFALNNGFGQAAFENALIAYIKRVTDNIGNNEGTKPVPPVGPFISQINLDYDSSQNILFNNSDKTIFEQRPAKFFHLAPFGHAEQHPLLKTNAADKNIYLLPQFKHLNTEDKNITTGLPVSHEAESYIGITGLKPPQNLALLFQVVDGTADPLSAKPDPHLHWSYLRDNEWIAFPKDQVEDQTSELTRAGIVTFAVPRDAKNTNTLLPAGMHWIRMAVEKESDTVSRLQLVAAQALLATFSDQKNDPAFPAKTLEAGTISKLDQPDAAVKKIVQPFATFGGRGQEVPAVFYTRISERLRHKDRAIALWDYERLVLEAFPQLYKAKCLNHTQYEPNESGTGIYRELAAGHVTVVTIPNQQFQNLRDPLKPYTSLGLLLEVDAFLRKRLSCFVKLHVKNPQFEEVWTDFRVKFYDGYDETFYIKKLQQEITRFLSPWAYGGASPSFGGKIYKSVLINFVEERFYVDYIIDFKLYHTHTAGDLNEVEGATAVSILVSVPESKHIIKVLTLAEEETAREKCPCEA